MRRLLEYCQDDDPVWWHGVLWAIGLPAAEFLRVLFFAISWGISYRYYTNHIVQTQVSSSHCTNTICPKDRCQVTFWIADHAVQENYARLQLG